MKTVFNDISTIAHMWANKIQDSAKFRGGNFYYEGDTIYSYGSHFPIAKHIEYNGVKAILFTLNTWSKTTAKHVWAVKSACNHLNIVYCLKPDANNHDANFRYWIGESEGILNSLKTARKPEKYLNELGRVADQVNKYAGFFEIEIPASLKALLNVSNKDQYAEYQSKKIELLEAERKDQERRDKAKHKKALAEWQAGRTDRLYCRDGFDYLRADLSGDCVQTTQGVNIPMSIAEKFWERIKTDTLNVGDTITDQHKHKYEVSEVGDTIRIGCHTFERNYVLKFGKKLFADRVV